MLKDKSIDELYYYYVYDRIHFGISPEIRYDDLMKEVTERYNREHNSNLDYKNDIDRLSILTWLKDSGRLLLLNVLFANMVYRFSNIEKYKDNEYDHIDDYFIDNIDLMNEIINKEEDNVLKEMGLPKKELSKVDNVEIEEMVADILYEIEPNGDWLDTYVGAIRSAHIIKLNRLSKKNLIDLKMMLGVHNIGNIDNTCLVLGNKDRYLFLDCKDDISDVGLIIHEFAHYINEISDNGREVSPMLREFPSIFYEMYCLRYLKQRGYSDEEITMANYHRLFDNYNISLEIKDIMDYLLQFIMNGGINKIDDKQKCDKCIEKIVTDPYVLFKCYPYIVSSYLAREAISKIDKDPFLLSIMKYITENLSKLDAADVFTLLNIEEKRKILR